MSSTVDLGSYLIVILFVSGMSIGIYSLSQSVLYPRGVEISQFYEAESQYSTAQNITSQLSDKIRETGIEDEGSQSKIISVAWSGLKLFMRLPSLASGFINSIASAMNMSIGTFSLFALAISILIVAVVWTLINMVVLGGIR